MDNTNLIEQLLSEGVPMYKIAIAFQDLNMMMYSKEFASLEELDFNNLITIWGINETQFLDNDNTVLGSVWSPVLMINDVKICSNIKFLDEDQANLCSEIQSRFFEDFLQKYYGVQTAWISDN